MQVVLVLDERGLGKPTQFERVVGAVFFIGHDGSGKAVSDSAAEAHQHVIEVKASDSCRLPYPWTQIVILGILGISRVII